MKDEPVEYKDSEGETLLGVSRNPSAEVARDVSADVTDRLHELTEHAGVLSRKNTHLANALRAARQELAALHEDIKALQLPPLAHATVLAVDVTARTADVSIAGRRHRVGVGPSVVASSLHPGDDVVLNEHLVITATCPSPRFGEVVTVKETYDDGTVLVLARHDEEQVLTLSAVLTDRRPRVGDALVADLLAAGKAPRERERTVVLVTHRLTPLWQADRVILLSEEDGRVRVAAAGKHEELANLIPDYRWSLRQEL